MTCHVFSMGHCNALNNRSLRGCQKIHGRPLLKKNHMWLNRFSVLYNSWSKRHRIIEMDFLGPRFPLLAESCHMILITYHHPCWASGQLKNLYSIDFTDCRPQWGQLLSISVEICPRHSLPAMALCMTNQRKATSFCPFALKLGILTSQQKMSPWRSTLLLEYVSYCKQVLNG